MVEDERAHLMVLPVRMRIHWGMGLFCFCFLPRIFLVLKVFWDGCNDVKGGRVGWGSWMGGERQPACFFFVTAHWEPTTESPKEIALPPIHNAVVASSSSPGFRPPRL